MSKREMEFEEESHIADEKNTRINSIGVTCHDGPAAKRVSNATGPRTG